ncbi:G-protein coupled receptor dmsr-1 [Anabrus simplex]|uniref:G-protein coupled receptor dmsr-1 n=1 Tax=Anabrus simplex TaxID=316456 RepID=UPI0034DDABCB
MWYDYTDIMTNELYEKFNKSYLLNYLNMTEEELDLFINKSSEVNTSLINPAIAVPVCAYCDGNMKSLAMGYRRIHGYVSLAVCLFGTVANLLNVAVLTRKDMACAPINRILTGLAVADMLVMVEYVPFACYMYFILPRRLEYTYSSAAFLLFHMHFAQVLHTISICLTLTLAVWRYIAIRYPEQNRVLCTQRRCHLAIAISYTLPMVVCIPSYLVFSIKATSIMEDNQPVVLYHVGLSSVAEDDDELLHNINFWVYAVVVKLLPCAILTVISCWLVKALYRANQRKQALKGYTNCGIQPPERRSISKSERRTDRTTRMLVAVLLLFLITEFPQGIMGLLSGVLEKCFFNSCYHYFGEVMDILALLNGAINFILYCSMSRQFRTNFGHLFKPRMLAKWGPPSQTDVQSTYV